MAAGRGGGAVVEALDTPMVCRLAGMRPATLDYWARTGLVTPSVRGSAGRRVPRLWSVRDATVVRALKALRDAGCSLQRLRKARKVLETGWSSAAADTVLYWDGHDVLAVMPRGELLSTIGAPGQLVFHVVALPIGPWADEGRTRAHPLAQGPQSGAKGSRSTSKRRVAGA
jgi:DNA-binding transcriptional MerR regulator